MKRWKFLLALACLAFAVSPAAAAVLFKGLQYAAQGACTVEVLPDTKLHVSNIGPSGDDGFSVSCPHMDGMRMALDGDCDDSDNGASVVFTLRSIVPSKGQVEFGSSARCAVSPGHVELSCDLSSLTSSSLQHVVLTRSGSAVYSCDVPLSSAVDVAMDATGQCPNPTMLVGLGKTPIERLELSAAMQFPRLVHVTVAGHDEDCDGVAFSVPVDETDQDCDGVSCDLRVSSPPGSHFSSLTCSSGQCSVFQHFVEGEGAAELLVVRDATGRSSLSASHLGVTGLDGLSVVRVPEGAGLYGGGGGGGAGGSAMGGAVAERFAPPSLVFDPALDEGASSVVTVVGEAFSSTGADLGAASASLVITIQGHDFRCIPTHTVPGADEEWVAVYSNGLEVARAMLPPGGGGVVVTPPPGQPLGMAINEKGLPGDKKPPKKSGTKSPAFAVQPDAIEASPPSASRGIAVDIRIPLHVTFANDRVFSCTGLSATGDELLCWTESSTAAPAAHGGAGIDAAGDYTGSFQVALYDNFVTNPNPASPLGSMTLLDLATAGGDPIQPSVPGGASLSSAHTCVTVPVTFTRTDSTPVRAYSVSFHLSPELALCGAGVVEGDYLSRIAGTQLYVTDHGSGAYTVDCGILGPVCGATGDGTLFSLNLASTLASSGVTSGTGVITVDAVTVRDCSNASVVADPGSPGYIPIQTAPPSPVTDLHAIQARTGNYFGGTTTISVTFPPLSPVSSLELYRKGFGNYPEYDNGSAPGSVPSPPASSSAALASGWTLVTCGSSCSSGSCTSTCTASSMLDSPQSRDYLYYVAFVRDAYGNESPVSNMTTGTLDYHLGDVSDGSSLCVGDNHVSLPDLSFLGAQYGRVLTGGPFTCLDVGPTLDYSVLTRPTTDGVADFEDFMMFAINWSVVSAPSAAARPVAAAMNASSLAVPSLPPAGQTFDAAVVVDGAGDVQGMSVKLAFDPDVLEQVGVAPGALLDQQGRLANVLSSGPGDVDAALFGGGPGIAGHGELARVTFRVKAAGDPHLAIASITARDAANHPIAVAGASGGAVVPARTALGFAYPNPFRESVAIQLSLHRTGMAAIGIYDVAGRRVRTLVRGEQPAGARLVTWDGRDDSGLRLAPGAYIVRLETEGVRESRTLRLVR